MPTALADERNRIVFELRLRASKPIANLRIELERLASVEETAPQVREVLAQCQRASDELERQLDRL